MQNPVAGILEQSVQVVETDYLLEVTTQVVENSPSFKVFPVNTLIQSDGQKFRKSH